MEKKTKVLVVDDSIFMRKVISDILNSDMDIEVVGTASNGAEALQMINRLQPSVVTMDIEMPVMDGLSCVRTYLKEKFVPIVMLSSLTREGANVTIEALEYGAVDFITKPVNVFDLKNEDIKQEIIQKVKMASKIKKEIKSIKLPEISEKPIYNKNSGNKSTSITHYIAIGTSTGGPKALQSVIPYLPGDIPGPVLIVQHMPAGFTKSLAERLNSMSELVVKEAEEGDILKAGYAYIAPGNYHMLFQKNSDGSVRIKIGNDPPEGGHRPCVNTMMRSLSSTGLKNIIGVIMTGMGGDGSQGIKMLKKENDGFIIAQDEATSVIYGMPKVAVQTGSVDTVVPLGEIASQIMKKIRGQK
ncbi:MAG TPA: chemotaxis response regulator protein-glutamate methylesterase [Clostridia bacterium]